MKLFLAGLVLVVGALVLGEVLLAALAALLDVFWWRRRGG